MRRLAAALLLAAALPAASVGGLDGTVAEGKVLVLDARTAALDGAARALADCDWVELAPAPAPAPASGRGLWLVDGGWLPVETLSSGADDRLAVRGPLGELELPLTAIAGWSDGPALPGAAGDKDQLLAASGLVAGRVQGIHDGKLVLASDLAPEEPLRIALAEVLGLRLAVAARPPRGTTLVATTAADRPGLRLAPAGDGRLALASAPSAAIAPPAGRLRVDGPRRIWLSDLKPAVREEKGAFGVVWPMGVDRAIGGGPLLLAGRWHGKGLVVHGEARLAWKLDGAYLRLRALAGISDQVAPEGDCAATLAGDGRELWSAPSVRGGQPPQAIDLDLAGVKQLELRVGLGARFDIGDHLALAGAYLVRK